MRKSDLAWAIVIIIGIIFCLITTLVVCVGNILTPDTHWVGKLLCTAWIFIFGYTVGVVVRGKENK